MTPKISLSCQNHKTYRLCVMDTECALNFSLDIVLVLHLFAFIPVASIHQFLIYGLHYFILFHYFLWEYHSWFMPFWFMPTFSGTQLEHKTRTWFTCFICNTFGCNNVDHMADLHCNNFHYRMFSSFSQMFILIISVQLVLKGHFQLTVNAIFKGGASSELPMHKNVKMNHQVV